MLQKFNTGQECILVEKKITEAAAMTRILIFITLLTLGFSELDAQEINTGGSMPGYYADPMVEEAPRNIILQNRCGNRVTLMFFDDRTDLQFIYKPNAFRRKEFPARNFSNRDNYTELFTQFRFPQIRESFIYNWDYDPFVTRLGVRTPWDAQNEITVLNIADENAFAIAARSPLLLAVKPHQVFDIQNGLLTEKFTDRGEEMVSFIKFNSLHENRFRVTSSGEYVLQIFENEVIIVGGEENMQQVGRVVKGLGRLSLEALTDRNEKILDLKMNNGLVHFQNPEFQEVIDLNHRIVYSGIDEGGACFGALNRIYYLIWVRDGAMTSSLMARAGNTELIKIWTPFLLNNPSITTRPDGEQVAEFLQMVGSRWTKSEDDGIYYATLSLFTYYQTTGQTDLLLGSEFLVLLKAINDFIDKGWNQEMGMIISDTRGETPLKSNPYFGYDVVNGNFERTDHHVGEDGRSISKSASLYNMVNTFNLLTMAAVMLDQRPDMDNGQGEKFLGIARAIQNTIRTKYVDPSGNLYSGYLQFDDGSDKWQAFARGADYWEYTWALSLGPFYPVLDLQIKSARMVPGTWPEIRTYGYCPWNTLSRILYEYGMSGAEYVNMLADEVSEARMLTRKYPMPGALTEYNTGVEGWRSLPFTAGSFFYSVSAQIIQNMPLGIGVRASNNVDRMDNFQFRVSLFDAIATGEGDRVEGYTLNGREIPHTLQIPESLMRFGRNELEIRRGNSFVDFRLYSSTAQLKDCSMDGDKVTYHFFSPVDAELVYENFERAHISVLDPSGEAIEYKAIALDGTGKTLVSVNSRGEFMVIASYQVDDFSARSF